MMNLPNLEVLAEKVAALSNDPAIQQLAACLKEWLKEDLSSEELTNRVEHYLGNSWIKKKDEYDEVYRLWSNFRDSC